MRTGAVRPSEMLDVCSSTNWVIHFTSDRKVDHRRATGLERISVGSGWDYPMAADGFLGPGADSFDALCEGLRFGGIVPGLPDGTHVLGGPPPVAIAQTLADVDFERRWEQLDTGCGIAVPLEDFLIAGATSKVIPGRDDLLIQGLFGWTADENEQARLGTYWNLEGGLETLDVLPLGEFSQVAVFVDFEWQVNVLQNLLTSQRLSSEFYSGLDPARHENVTIVRPIEGYEGSPRLFRGLVGFDEAPGVVVTKNLVEIRDRVLAAFSKGEKIIKSNSKDRSGHANCVLTFEKLDDDPITTFLIDADLTVRMPGRDKHALLLPSLSEPHPYLMDPIQASAMAMSLSRDLNIKFTVDVKVGAASVFAVGP